MSALAAALWVIAATIVAFLPMRRQYVPGVALLLLAPGLIFWLGYEYGWLVAVLGLFGFLSMFRRPLAYFWHKARGTTAGGSGEEDP